MLSLYKRTNIMQMNQSHCRMHSYNSLQKQKILPWLSKR